MDPYCQIKWNGKKYKTAVKKEAGKTPVWKHRFEWFIKDINEPIEIKVKDEDTFSDDLIGEASCRIKDLLGDSDMEHTKWVNLTFDGGRPAGAICFKT